MNTPTIKQLLLRLGVFRSDGSIIPKHASVISKHNLQTAVIEATSFLDADTDLKYRLHVIWVEAITKPTCKCGAQLSILKPRDGLPRRFSQFCSTKCSNSDPTTQLKKRQTNLRVRGVDNPSKSPQIKQAKTRTTIDTYGVLHPHHRHIDAAVLSKLQDAEWLKEQHIILKKSMHAIAWDMGVDVTTVQRAIHRYQIPVQRHNVSSGELRLHQFLSANGIEFESNVRGVLDNNRELDIVIPKFNLAIEFCGLYWHSEQRGCDKHYHRAKWEQCKNKGIQLLTIYEDEYWERTTNVERKLKRLCGILDEPTVYARRCDVIEVSAKERRQFLRAHHIQGDGRGSVTLGLQHNGKLVACMTFISNKDGSWYLNRYATSMNVVGGASKIFTHFIRNYEYTQVISFADLRWSSGAMYQKIGFELDCIIPPDYYYSMDGKRRIHKFNCRRSKLKRLLPTFDEALSERDNCDIAGWYRIWDCGKYRYVFNK